MTSTSQFSLTWAGAAGLAAINTADSVDGTEDEVTESAYGVTRGVVIVGCLVPGLIGLLGGGAMVAIGAIRYNKYKQWQRDNGFALNNGTVIAPRVSSTQHRTSTYGVSLRF